MILVTGGGGFIGSHLVQQLVNNNESVRVLERPGADTSHLPTEKIELVYADIRNRAAVDKATQACDYIYHLAADPNLWRKDIREFDAINFHGALNVINSALENGAKRIIHTSTESILTSPDFDGGSVEHLQLREEDMMGPYCLSKFKADQAALQLASEGKPVIVVCPTLPVGPGDRSLTPPTRMALAFCKGKMPAYLDCRFNLVDVRDCANGMIMAMHRGRPGIRYLLGGENYQLTDWLQMLAEEVNRPAPKYTVPYALAYAVAWISEIRARYVSGQMPLATVTGVRLTRRSMHFDAEPTRKELCITARPSQESARDLVAWFRQEGLIT